jgi:feruloyl esterase
MQAQRYPTAYDGIISGAPVIDLANLTAAGAFQAQQLSGPGFFPASKLPAIAAAVRAECDATDGLVDGLVDDPRECEWDPHALVCTGPETNACLTQAQADALEQLYKGARRADTNAKIYAGLERGGEDGFGPLGWSTSVTGPPSPVAPPGTPGIGVLLSGAYINNVAFQNPNPLFKTFSFDFAADLDFVISQLTTRYQYNANDPDLTAFKNRGGKVLMYHGWSDPVVPPRGSVDYHKAVRQKLGTQQALSALRLFMAPGMEHCVGGTGPFLFDAVTALEGWVERGVAPERIVATQVNLGTGAFVRSRPLCRYPMVARYTGSGDVNSAANFVCEESD